jgi:hypothetical protein
MPWSRYQISPAFSAYGLSSYTVSNGVEVVFSTVTINQGNGYSNSTGRFTAPVDGNYMFDWTFLSTSSSNSVDTRIKINNSTIFGAAFTGDNVTGYKSGGGAAACYLTAGQYVSISAFNTAYFHPDGAHQVFSGFLVL